VGVRSLTRPACSSCSKALESTEESTGSEFRSCALGPMMDWLRLCAAVGGVLDSGGEMRVGVAIPSSALAASPPPTPISSRAMVVIALCCDWRRRAMSAVGVGGSVAKLVEKAQRPGAQSNVYTGYLGNGSLE
jgi:hypothetical protein